MAQEGARGRHKRTGQELIYRGGQWVPFEAAEADADQDGRVGWGEDVGAGIQAGLRTGVAGLVGLPGAIQNTMDDAAQWATGNENLRVPNILNPMSMIGNRDRAFGFPEATEAVNKVWDKANEATIGENIQSDYRPETRTGRAAKLGAEMLPGAVMSPVKGAATAGQQMANVGKALLPTVVAPTATGTLAGEAFRGTGYEDLARGIGTLAGPLAVAGGQRLVRGKVPDVEQAADVAALRSQGIEPTAGQALDNNRLRMIEDMSERGQQLTKQSYGQFSNATVDKAVKELPEVASKLPAPTANNSMQRMTEALDGTADVLDDLAYRNKVFLGPDVKKAVAEWGRKYKDNLRGHSSAWQITDFLKGVDEHQLLDGKAYQTYRSQLSKVASQGADDINSETAGHLMDILNDAMQATLRESKNETDWARYQGAWKSYRDLLTAQKAFAKNASLRHQRVTPDTLSSAVRGREGDRSVVSGRNTFGELYQPGSRALNTKISSESGENILSVAAPAAAAAGLGTAAGAVAGPLGGIAGAGAGLMAPKAFYSTMATKMVQDFLKRGFNARSPLTQTLTDIWGNGSAAMFNPNYWAQMGGPGNQQ